MATERGRSIAVGGGRRDAAQWADNVPNCLNTERWCNETEQEEYRARGTATVDKERDYDQVSVVSFLLSGRTVGASSCVQGGVCSAIEAIWCFFFGFFGFLRGD